GARSEAASGHAANTAEVNGSQPATLQLRSLQTLTEIAAEKNSTIVFPKPPAPAPADLNGNALITMFTQEQVTFLHDRLMECWRHPSIQSAGITCNWIWPNWPTGAIELGVMTW